MNPEVPAVIKRLKLLIVILVLSNLTVGALSFHFLRKVDADYSELIDRSLPTMSHLRGMTTESSLVHRSLTFALSAQRSERRDTYVKTAEDALKRGNQLVAETLPVLRTDLGAEQAERLQKADATYRASGMAVVELLREGNPTEAGVKIRDLRLALDEFMNVVAKLSDNFEQHSQDQNDIVSAEIRTQGTIVLGLGGWPLALLAVLGLVIAVVLILMIILTHRLGSQDEPA
jgi:hypothetical protein